MYTKLLSLFYSNDTEFDRSERRSAAQVILLIDQGLDRVYFPEMARSLFIPDNPEEKETTKREFEQAGLNINYVDGGHYLGDYLGPREELEEWLRPKVDVWAHEVRILAQIAKRYP